MQNEKEQAITNKQARNEKESDEWLRRDAQFHLISIIIALRGNFVSDSCDINLGLS